MRPGPGLLPLLLLLGACVPVRQASDDLAAIPVDDWTWVDFPGSACADGSPTGLGLNRGTDPTTLVVYFQGGGACWDGETCHGPFPRAANVARGYGHGDFAREANRAGILFLVREDADNPFPDATLAFVPYCTGDLHRGDRVVALDGLGQTHTTHFVGARNAARYLRRLAESFPDVRQVWLTGASAGGYGALLNLEEAHNAFPHARVDVIDDSGVPVTPEADLFARQRDAWNLRLPEDCADCGQSFDALLDHYAARFPDSRVALLSFDRDPVIAHYAGISEDEFSRQLAELPGTATQRVFVVEGANHVVLQNKDAATGGVRWTAWLRQMVDGSPAWGDVHPE